MITGHSNDGRPACVFKESECVPAVIEAARLRGECRVLLLSPAGLLFDVDAMERRQEIEFVTHRQSRGVAGGAG